VAIKQDVSQRKRASEELHWKTALLEAQVNSSLDGILVVDGQNKQLLKNGRFNEIMKIPRHIAEDPDDAKSLEYVTAHVKNPALFIERVNHLNSHPEEIGREEIELVDGTVLDRYSSPVRDQEGGYFGRIWAFRDITDRKRAEASLHDLHKKLMEASRQAGMAEIATNVLHNVGNVLNSVNVSAAMVVTLIRKSKLKNLPKVVGLLRENEANLGAFFSQDPRAGKLPSYLDQLAGLLEQEQSTTLKELAELQKNIEHIKEIVALQQSYAKVSGVLESLQIRDVVEEALRMNASALARRGIQVARDYGEVPPITTEKHKVLQILINLIRNAQYACDQSGQAGKLMTMRVVQAGERIRISVSDNGMGIPAENLTRIFNHGFTTRKDGHGFGLHGGALTAKELGGVLSVHSDGPGRGAVFTLELPATSPSTSPTLEAITTHEPA